MFSFSHSGPFGLEFFLDEKYMRRKMEEKNAKCVFGAKER